MQPPGERRVERSVRPEFVQSLAHGLAAIRSFSRERPTQTLSEVAEAIGVTRATARRLLLTLQDLGYVGSSGRKFFLRPAVLTIGSTYLSLGSMWEGAQGHLKTLAAAVGESCGASVLDDTDAVHVVRAVADDLMAINIPLGARLPAYCTAVGRVLLAQLEPAALDAYLARVAPARRTARTLVDPEALRRLVDQVRQQGWAEDDQEWRDGIRAIAAPIADGATQGAVDVVCLASRLGAGELRRRVLPRLLETAERISARASAPEPVRERYRSR